MGEHPIINILFHLVMSTDNTYCKKLVVRKTVIHTNNIPFMQCNYNSLVLVSYTQKYCNIQKTNSPKIAKKNSSHISIKSKDMIISFSTQKSNWKLLGSAAQNKDLMQVNTLSHIVTGKNQPWSKWMPHSWKFPPLQ